MVQSHLPIACFFDTVRCLVRQVTLEAPLDSTLKHGLEAHAQKLLEYFAQYREHEEHVCAAASRILGDSLQEATDLCANSTRIHELLDDLLAHLQAMPEGVGPEDIAWQRLEGLVENMTEAFERDIEYRWAFFQTYSTILAPSGSSSQ